MKAFPAHLFYIDDVSVNDGYTDVCIIDREIRKRIVF